LAFNFQPFLPLVSHRLPTTRTLGGGNGLFRILIGNHHFSQPLPKPLAQLEHLALNIRELRLITRLWHLDN
jgi:hypothetical protein